MSGRIVSAMAPLPLGVWLRKPRHELPFPLGEPGSTLFAQARHGLWQGVRALGLEPGDEVLVPAFHHGSEVEALVRAGLVPRFYDGTDWLEPDEEELETRVGPRTRALHLTHFLGFPQDAARWRRFCDDRGLLLIEDAAQSWLSARNGRPVGSDGDLAVFCLYKSFGLPDGAALILRRGSAHTRAQRPHAAVELLQEHTLWLASRSRLAARLLTLRAGREQPYSPAQDFALGDPGRPPSLATILVLPRVAGPAAAAKRRSNFVRLLELLPGGVSPAFAQLPAAASPFVFPLESDRKPELLRRLDVAGIRALNLWSVPHPLLRADEFPRARSLRERVLGLPVHQELRDEDLERVALAVRR